MGRCSLRCKKLNKMLILLLIVFSGFLISTSEVETKAAGWVDHNADIYNQEKQTSKNEDIEQSYNGEFDGEEQGGITQFIAEFLYDVANALHGALSKLSFDIDSIVLGRVQYDSDDVNLLGFELAPGNPYGIVSSIVYVVIRGIIFIALAVQVEALIVKYIFKKSAKTKETLKDELGSTSLMIVALVLMPYLFDLAIYVRDLMLSGIRYSISSMIGNAGLNMWDTISYTYEQSGGAIIPAALCLGTSALSLVFIGSYAAITLSMCILFICFAFICVYGSSRRKKALEEWRSMVLANLAIPIFDYILIIIVALIPFFAGNNIAASIVQLFLAWNILKARSMVLNVLSLRTAQPVNGIGGLLGLMAAGRFLKNGLGTLINAGEKVSGALADKKAAEQEEELEDVNANYDSVLGTAPTEGTSPLSGASLDGYSDEGQEKDAELFGDNSESGASIDNSGGMQEDNDTQSSVGIEREGEEPSDNSMSNSTDADRIRDDGENNEQIAYDDLQSDNSYLRNRNKDINNEIGRNEAAITKNNDDIAKIDDNNAKAREELEQLKETGQGDSKQARALESRMQSGEDRIAGKKAENEEFRKRNEDLQHERSENAKRMNNNNRRMASGSYQNNVRPQGESISGYGSRLTDRYDPNTASERDKKIHDIIKKRANINNFDSPQFQGLLSHAEMAEFYKKRARKNIVSAAAQTGGFGAGSVLGMAAGSWLGPAVMASMGDIGGSIGGTVGNGAGVIAFEATNAYRRHRSGRLGNGSLGANGNNSPNPNNTPPEMGNEQYNVRDRVRSKLEWADLPETGMNDFRSKDILERDSKTGEFIIEMNEKHRTLEERVSASARNAAKYHNESPENKQIITDSVIRRYEAAVKNGIMSQSDVTDAIRNEYTVGLEQLTEQEKADTLSWIEDITNEFNRRKSK